MRPMGFSKGMWVLAATHLQQQNGEADANWHKKLTIAPVPPSNHFTTNTSCKQVSVMAGVVLGNIEAATSEFAPLSQRTRYYTQCQKTVALSTTDTPR